MLMRNGVDLRPLIHVFFIDNGVWKPIEVKHPEPTLHWRPTLLVFDNQIADSLVLGEKGQCDHRARPLGVVRSSVSKLLLRFRMKPVIHPIRARTRARASSPGTMATVPSLTS